MENFLKKAALCKNLKILPALVLYAQFFNVIVEILNAGQWKLVHLKGILLFSSVKCNINHNIF